LSIVSFYFIKEHGYSEFASMAMNWKNAYGKYK